MLFAARLLFPVSSSFALVTVATSFFTLAQRNREFSAQAQKDVKFISTNIDNCKQALKQLDIITVMWHVGELTHTLTI